MSNIYILGYILKPLADNMSYDVNQNSISMGLETLDTNACSLGWVKPGEKLGTP